FRRPDHPIAYGYPERTSAFREDRTLWAVRRADEGRVVMQWGTKLPKEDETEATTAASESAAPTGRPPAALPAPPATGAAPAGAPAPEAPGGVPPAAPATAPAGQAAAPAPASTPAPTSSASEKEEKK